MRLSKYLMPVLREAPGEADIISHKLMLRAGMIKKTASGIFSYLPLGYRSLRKVENIVRDEMNRIGAQELMMPVMHPAELWKETGRWEEMGDLMFTLKDRHARDFCLGPTHEEIVTDIARNFIQSYRQLPFTVYQIQTKFRDEIRPRFGLMRAREFLMKDAYSFHTDAEDALREYEAMFQSYHRIFSRCGLAFRAVEAATGNIGGSKSHEFQVLSQSGEDEILSCDQCNYAGNSEFVSEKKGDKCPRCKKGKMIVFRGIEVGHIFVLGNKYSKSMKAAYLNESGKQCHYEMGCYGIGIGRTMAAAIEQCHDPDGIIWPISIAPFEVVVVPLNMMENGLVETADRLYESLKQKNVDVLIHDKDERAGVKFKDADLIGIPIRVTVGAKGIAKNQIDVKMRHQKNEHQIPLDQAPSEILKIRNELFRKVNSCP